MFSGIRSQIFRHDSQTDLDLNISNVFSPRDTQSIRGGGIAIGQINSEGFLAEVFHPWVRWEGPGSGFENSSGASGAGAGGVWKSRIHRFGPLGIEVEKTRFSNGLAYNRSKKSVKQS